jgi:lycopene cyclase domain-containing protein
MRATYLLIDFFTVLVPFLFSFYRRIRFNTHFRAFISGNFITAACFIAWDLSFTHWKVWGFNEAYTLGYKIFNLPVEEVLFFICIPFACLFTYHCLTTFYTISWTRRVEKTVVLVLSLLFLLVGMVYIDKMYTAVTFISTGILLLALEFAGKVSWLPGFLTIYPVLLIPFFIVNGLLTGTGLQQPVVWYNDAENTGIRLMTIPVEDVVYGLELLLCNCFFYEKFKPVFTGSLTSV